MSLDAAAIAELTGRAQQGSEDAFNELYRLTRDRAYFVAFSIARNEEDALDILQETYLRAWQNLHTIENPALFDPWLRRVTGNAAKNYVKKRKPKLFDRKDNEADFLEELPDEEKYEPAAEMDNEETRRLILELVDELPEDQRLCVLMRYYGDMDVTEIAEALDIPYETAKSRLRYGKKKISDGVEALEKKGTKLHGAAPLPLLAWALRGTAKASGAKLPSVILKDGAVAAGGAAVSGGGVLAAMSLPKIIAGVAAAVVIGGGSITGVVIARSEQTRAMTAAPTAAASEETPAAQSFPPQALSVFTEGSAVYDAYARPGTHTQPARSAAASAALPPEPATGGTVIQNTSSAAQTITLPSSTAMATAAAAATATATTATRYSYTAASNPGQAVTTTSTTTTTTTTKGTTTSTTTTTTTTTQPVARTLGPVNGVTVEFKSNQLPASASLSVTSGITMNTRVIDPNSPTPATPVATYSIKLQAGGADVQPQGYVTVKLPVPSGVSDVSALRVYHATDAVTTSEMIWHLEGSLICFETNYF